MSAAEPTTSAAPTAPLECKNAEVVTLDYNDLVAGKDLSEFIEKAYGYDGIGLLTVSNVPSLVEKRATLLPLANRLANLPADVLEKYVHEESHYSFGWSHGKENLEGKPDESKGSFYANPQYDRPEDDEAIIQKYPAFLHPNIWPTAEIPELEPAFKELGQLIVNVGKLVARQVDTYIKSKCPAYENSKLEKVINTSKCCKARLLHYFARSNEDITAMDAQSVGDAFSSWCGWHNDHGSLTGLVSAIYIDENNGHQIVQNTDSSAGLYVRSRHSDLIKVAIPPDHIAFQIGETAQIHSGGIVQATPHAVRGSHMPGVSRETFAVFMEPNWVDPVQVPEGMDPVAAQSNNAALNLPRGVPALAKRWNNTMNFATFTEETLKSYY